MSKSLVEEARRLLASGRVGGTTRTTLARLADRVEELEAVLVRIANTSRGDVPLDREALYYTSRLANDTLRRLSPDHDLSTPWPQAYEHKKGEVRNASLEEEAWNDALFLKSLVDGHPAFADRLFLVANRIDFLIDRIEKLTAENIDLWDQIQRLTRLADLLKQQDKDRQQREAERKPSD